MKLRFKSDRWYWKGKPIADLTNDEATKALKWINQWGTRVEWLTVSRKIDLLKAISNSDRGLTDNELAEAGINVSLCRKIEAERKEKAMAEILDKAGRVWVFNGVRIGDLTPEMAAQALKRHYESLPGEYSYIPAKVLLRLKEIAKKSGYTTNPLVNGGQPYKLSNIHNFEELDNNKKTASSIFDGLDDKQALRAMADECTKRGLSIMVNMSVKVEKNNLLIRELGKCGNYRNNLIETHKGSIHTPWNKFYISMGNVKRPWQW